MGDEIKPQKCHTMPMSLHRKS